MRPMVTLKQAIEKGRLKQFIKEHEGEEGDMEAFNRAVQTMAGKSSEARPASSPDDSDD